MIQIGAIAFNSFQVNTYLVWDETKDCLVVDPAFHGEEEIRIFESFLFEHNFNLSGQINTHCHIDHVLGVQYLQTRYKLPLRAHKEEVGQVSNAHLMGEIFGISTEPISGIDQFIEDQEFIEIGNHSLEAIHVPGHSKGSLSFYSPEGTFVITGDALFSGSIGRTDLPGGDYDELISSIQNRIMTLPSDTTIYPGHGPSSTIRNEAFENPFLRKVE